MSPYTVGLWPTRCPTSESFGLGHSNVPIAERIDLTPVLGNKAQIYRRAVGGSFYVVLWLSRIDFRQKSRPPLSVELKDENFVKSKWSPIELLSCGEFRYPAYPAEPAFFELTVSIFVVLGDGRGGVLALTLELGRDGLRGVPLLFLFWPPLMSILSSNLLYIVFESL